MSEQQEITTEKRKRKKTRKGYFYEKEENAVREYLLADDQATKDKIFNEILYTAFTMMIESIIRRYNLYIPDEEFDETFDDTMSFLISKLNKFNPEKGYKSYSYCGTICKNYLIYKINKFIENQKRNTSYDIKESSLIDSLKYSYDDTSSATNNLQTIMTETAVEINNMIERREQYGLTDNEVKVGNAIIELLTNWGELFIRMGSDKFNKSSILMFLKETTLLSTKEIRDAGKKYKKAFLEIKKNVLDNSD